MNQFLDRYGRAQVFSACPGKTSARDTSSASNARLMDNARSFHQVAGVMGDRAVGGIALREASKLVRTLSVSVLSEEISNSLFPKWKQSASSRSECRFCKRWVGYLLAPSGRVGQRRGRKHDNAGKANSYSIGRRGPLQRETAFRCSGLRFRQRKESATRSIAECFRFFT
jgi:hypothetical protein